MKTKPILFLILLSLAAFSSAQSIPTETRIRRSSEILGKLRQIEILNQILPVVMTKEQIRQLLPTLEEVRATVKKTEELEYEEIAKLEARVDTALKEAYEIGKVPTQELFTDYLKTFARLSKARQLIADVNSGKVLAKLKEILNEGQLKLAENALTIPLSDPSQDPTKLDAEKKQLYFVKQILLDPMTYDILIKLSK